MPDTRKEGRSGRSRLPGPLNRQPRATESTGAGPLAGLTANPLTARVTVNRLWRRFRHGLVKTTENFGVQGEPPSHPALLDWLATEFIRTGWDVKAMQRLVVTSATYRQASKASAALVQRDPENRLLARGPRFRLPAELVRDNAPGHCRPAGREGRRAVGQAVSARGFVGRARRRRGEGPYVQDKGGGLYRRSLYVYRKRTVPHPALATFDAPSREVCQVKRARAPIRRCKRWSCSTT